MVADPTIYSRRDVTVDEYDRILAGYKHTELLDGTVVVKTRTSPRRASVCTRINERLHRLTSSEVPIYVRSPLRLAPRSEPEPDFTMLRPRDHDYRFGHPTAQDVLLLIEVADATPPFLYAKKLLVYAQHTIVEVWIVDADAGVVRVHTDPDGDGYRTEHTLGRNNILVPTEVEDVRIPVSDIL